MGRLMLQPCSNIKSQSISWLRPNTWVNAASAAVKSVNWAICSHPALIGQINARFLTFPPALCADDDASFQEDGRSFITLTCAGGGGSGNQVLREEWIDDGGHTDRRSVRRRHSACMRAVYPPLRARSAPSLMTLLGHAGYSSLCWGIRYENSLSTFDCVRKTQYNRLLV